MAERAVASISAAWIQQIEQRQRIRHVHWSSAAWNQVVQEALPKICLALETATPEEQLRIAENYLRLVSEGIGLGALFPHPPAEFPNIYSVVLENVLPRLLISVQHARAKAEAMSILWNVCDAVQAEPAWLEALLIDEVLSWRDLDDITGKLNRLQRDLFARGKSELSARTTVEELHYHPIALWPLGFFLPERVQRCGPDVFSVVGRSPHGVREFYVLVGAGMRVLPKRARSDDGAADAAAKAEPWAEPWAGALLERLFTGKLARLDFAVSERAIGAVYADSEQLHLWVAGAKR